MFPYVFGSGSSLQPLLYVTQNAVIITIPNYKKDNGTPVPGTGDLGLDPPVDDPRTLFCVGEDIKNFIFTDATVFDCQLAAEPDLPNIRPRNVQFVYGTHNPAAGIPNVFIDVNGTPVQVTDNNGVAISGVWHVNPDGTPNGPGYTTPSGFFEGPVIKYLWDPFSKLMITPMAQTYPISHTGDYVNDQENDIFDVTLRNWGPCNPYDGANLLTYLDAVTEFSRLRLVGAPPLPTAPDLTICLGSPTTLSAVRNGTNPGMLHWYNNSDLLPIHEVGTGATYNPGALAAGVYNYWVREIGTTGMLCEGPAEQVVLTIYPVITNNTVAATQAICYNTAPAGLTGTAPAGGTGIYGYQWQSSADNVTFNNIGGATAANYSPGALTSTTWYRRIVNSGPCSNISASIQITVYANLTAGTIQSAQSICYNTAPAALTQATAPAGGTGAYTYQWQDSPDNATFTNIGGATGVGYAPPVLTANRYYRRNVTSGSCGTVSSASILITVYANLTAGTVGSAQTICYNTAPAALTQLTPPSGGPGGYTYQWQSSPDNSVWTSIGGATGVGYTSVALTANTYFRRQVTSGSCGTVSSPSFLITVYANLTAGTIGTAQSICYNTAPAALTQLTAPTGGTGAYTYQWQDSPDNVTFNNIGGATGVGYAPPVLTATRYYRRNVTSGTCGTVSSASVTITVNGILAAGTIGTAQSICYNTAPAALTQITAPTGGTGAYTYQWQDSPDNVTFTNIGGATGVGYAPPVLTANRYYRRKVTSGSCGTVKQRFNINYSLRQPHIRDR